MWLTRTEVFRALTVFFPIESLRLSLVLSSQLRAPALLQPLQLSVDFCRGEILWSAALWEQFSVPSLPCATSRLTFNLCMASRPWDSLLWTFPFSPFTSLSLAWHNLCVVLLFAEVCSYSGPTIFWLWPLCDMAPRRWHCSDGGWPQLTTPRPACSQTRVSAQQGKSAAQNTHPCTCLCLDLTLTKHNIHQASPQ